MEPSTERFTCLDDTNAKLIKLGHQRKFEQISSLTKQPSSVVDKINYSFSKITCLKLQGEIYLQLSQLIALAMDIIPANVADNSLTVRNPHSSR